MVVPQFLFVRVNLAPTHYALGHLAIFSKDCSAFAARLSRQKSMNWSVICANASTSYWWWLLAQYVAVRKRQGAISYRSGQMHDLLAGLGAKIAVVGRQRGSGIAAGSISQSQRGGR